MAYAGRRLGVAVTVVVPETASARARELLRLENAEVIVHGASWQEANELALSLVGAADAFIHPFDDPLLWQGHATLVDEVHRAGFVPDAVVLSVGGGGLLSGVAEGLHRNGWSHVPILAVETEGAVVSNIKRKEADAMKMAENMVEHMKDLNAANLKGQEREKSEYKRDVKEGDGWKLHLADCVERTVRILARPYFRSDALPVSKQRLFDFRYICFHAACPRLIAG